MSTVHALHLAHGAIVQTGPREISFASARACREIYSFATKCLKSPIYEKMGHPGLHSFTDRGRHRERKRRLAYVFAQSALNDLEPMVQNQVVKFTKLAEKSIGKPWDIVQPLRMLALDIAGEVLLGQSFNALGAEETPYYVTIMEYVQPMIAINGGAPWLATLLKKIPSKWARDFTGSSEYIYGVRIYMTSLGAGNCANPMYIVWRTKDARLNFPLRPQR